MFHTYLVTGASGFLGRAVLAELKKKGVPIRALVMKNDPLAAGLPEGVSVFYGDVCDTPHWSVSFPVQTTGLVSSTAPGSYRWRRVRESGSIM